MRYCPFCHLELKSADIKLPYFHIRCKNGHLFRKVDKNIFVYSKKNRIWLDITEFIN